MKKLILLPAMVLFVNAAFSQTSPAIASWLRNTTGITGRHYIAGNSTPINDAYPANVQTVQYTTNNVYVSCSGIPSYIIGPYQDGNPSQGVNNNNIYKISLNPVKNNGNPTNTNGGTIGVFINGVSLFDYRDGVSYNINTGTNQGGPTGGMGNGVWNRDAIVAERVGFDCAKGHPAMGNYHHHQNPSAFNLDLSVISNVCNLYLADGLYVIDSTKHAPLIGFAYDGFPIYGAYGYKNTDGTGGITRIKSSYSLRDITVRTHYANGTDVTDGPNVGGNFPLGMYREDYQYNPTSAATPDFLDEHNGRFCVTPEYPNGIYCYFSTVNENWNSAYPYVVGPTFYGVKSVTRVATVTEPTTIFTGLSATDESVTMDQLNLNVYPNPTADLIILQAKTLLEQSLTVQLADITGKIVLTKSFNQGSTICHLETETLYNGTYFLTVNQGKSCQTFKVVINK
jgi:YHYH protein/Secretion system C-terminal sorting domain